jgi:chromosome segregation ATPase
MFSPLTITRGYATRAERLRELKEQYEQVCKERRNNNEQQGKLKGKINTVDKDIKFYEDVLNLKKDDLVRLQREYVSLSQQKAAEELFNAVKIDIRCFQDSIEAKKQELALLENESKSLSKAYYRLYYEEKDLYNTLFPDRYH